jgi:hypothetical protein
MRQVRASVAALNAADPVVVCPRIEFDVAIAGDAFYADRVSEVEDAGWRPVRPAVGPRKSVEIDALIPNANWFWYSLQRVCVPECCGLAAYDFSAESVAWACGWGAINPEGIIKRDPAPGDVLALIAGLREASHAVRAIGADAVSAALFNDILTPDSYADLLQDLAIKAQPQIP